MSKDNKIQLLSPLFLKYQADFEKNSRSRVFAPLAEAYRKLGMTDKAMEILSQGIRFHPSYVMGYLGLAFCYFDLKQFNLAYSTLRPLIETNRDNLRLQKLFSDTCLELGKKDEALETLKYLLFISPRDKEVAESVSRLEREVEERYRTQHKPIIIPERELTGESPARDSRNESSLFNLNKLGQSEKSDSNDFDDWMTIDLSHESATENKTATQETPKADSSTTSFDHWNVKKGDQTFEAHKDYVSEFKSDYKTVFEEEREEEQEEDHAEDHEEKREYSLNYISVPEKAEATKEILLDLNSEKEDETPLVTHTLVDLYCGQGHIEKALEVLEKILLLNPNDQKTISKIKEIQALVQPLEQYDEARSSNVPTKNEEEVVQAATKPVATGNSTHLVELNELEDVSEEDGRRHLMSLIDEKLGPIEIEEDTSRVEKVRELEEKLSLFLRKIQKRALDYQGRV